MLMIVRIGALSTLVAALGASTAFVIYQGHDDYVFCIFFAFWGSIVGAVAGAGHEIATAIRETPSFDCCSAGVLAGSVETQESRRGRRRYKGAIE